MADEQRDWDLQDIIGVRDREHEENVARAVDSLAARMAVHYHALISRGVDEQTARMLVAGYQGWFLAGIRQIQGGGRS